MAPQTDPSPAPVVISGKMTAESVARIRQKLLTALRKGNVSLDLQKVTEVDLCGLQLLCSAHRSSVRMARELVLASLPAVVDAAARAAGLSPRPVVCAAAGGECLWNSPGLTEQGRNDV